MILLDGSLVVANVGEVHEGTYTCVVTNPLGMASGTVILTVNSKCDSSFNLLCTRPYSHTCTSSYVYYYSGQVLVQFSIIP